MKGVLLIIDGLGDLPVPALGGKTPLEAAATPVLDRLAARGRYGLVDPIQPGEIPNTHTGAGVLLGLSPGQSDRLRRGPVEAAGLGFDLRPGDIALRANLATLEPSADGYTVTDRRAGRIVEGTAELTAAFARVELGEGVTAVVRPTEQHRLMVLLSGPGLDEDISDTDPGDRNIPAPLRECRALRPAAEDTANLVNRLIRLAHRDLREHPVNQRRLQAGLLPANGVITRGAGAALSLENFIRDAGLRACVVSGCNTVRGLGRMFGFDEWEDRRFTGGMDTDVDAKIDAAMRQLVSHDLVFVHIKAPDICSHDLQPLAKRDFLQRMDAALAPLLDQDLLVAVAADHTTDSNTGLHTPDPVPAIISIPGQQGPGTEVKFGESACRGGNLARQTAYRFMLDLVSALA